MKTPRIYRKARDRAISIALALFIGAVFGVGGWLVLNRPAAVEKETPVVAAPATSEASVAAAKTPMADKVPARRALQSHKALYAIKLLSAKNGSQIINISGRMYFQVQHACEAWITDHRFALDYEYADTSPMRIVSDFSTVESIDGKSFDFSSRRRRDGELYQELRGRATLDPQAGGAAEYVEPPTLSFDLEPGSVFPTQHTRMLLDAARAGKKLVSAIVFDGTDEEGPVQISAVIGEKVGKAPAFADKKDVDAALLAGDAWKVRMAFFPLNSTNDTPDYELVMTLHDNGVISDMTIDYQDFSVTQSLEALAAVPDDPCGAEAASRPKTSETPVNPPLPRR